MKKIVGVITLGFFLFVFPVMADVIEEEVFLGERIDVGCFYIWLHADGLTWQNTDGLSGPEEPYGGTDLDHDPDKEKYLRYSTFQAEPKEEWGLNYKDIRVEADIDWFQDFTAEDYVAAGGAGKASKDGQEYIFIEDYDEFNEQVYARRPHNYQLAPEISPLTVKFYLHDKHNAENVKQEDQLELVEGWRWYLPIHLKFYGVPRPVLVDLEAVELQQVSPVMTGSRQMASAVLRNNGEKEEEFTVRYWAAGQLVNSEVLNLAAGESCWRNFNWEAPSEAGQCPLKIEILPLEGEVDLSNNVKTAVIKVEKTNFINPQCIFMNIDEHEWTETYSWWVSYDCSYVDEEGILQPRSCSTRKQETVTYREWLTVDFKINTKQGEPGGGRESRGYWEISVDTQNRKPQYNAERGINIYGEDPNKVTRSGYGYDLTVVTTYGTDWETKVPRRGRAKGGQFYGPSQVVVQLHNGQDLRELVPVKKEREGLNEITTWKLPLSEHTFPDGETIAETKYYTDVAMPDGAYLVRAIIASCGKEISEICQDEMLYIYGSVYDDIYTRPARESEW